MRFKQNDHYLKPGVLLPARILFILIDAPWMQLSATETLKICPPFKENHRKLVSRNCLIKFEPCQSDTLNVARLTDKIKQKKNGEWTLTPSITLPSISNVVAAIFAKFENFLQRTREFDFKARRRWKTRARESKNETERNFHTVLKLM